MSGTKKFTRLDIVRAVSDKRPEFIKSGIRVLVNETLDALADALASGNLVEIRRLGVFSIKRLPARKSRNPRTGQEINVEEFTGIKFKVSRDIKSKLRKGKNNVG